jgi:hypothetical protein
LSKRRSSRDRNRSSCPLFSVSGHISQNLVPPGRHPVPGKHEVRVVLLAGLFGEDVEHGLAFSPAQKPGPAVMFLIHHQVTKALDGFHDVSQGNLIEVSRVHDNPDSLVDLLLFSNFHDPPPKVFVSPGGADPGVACKPFPFNP